MSIIATPPAPESGQTDLRAAMPLPWSIVINENCNALLLDAKGDAFAVMKGPRHAENARILLAALATQPSAPQESGELAKLREAVPDGASIGKNGVTYYGIEEIYWHFEDGAALHMCLDKAGIPRADEAGIVYSLWGRVQQFATPQEMIHRIGHALFLADVLIDSVPTRAQNSDNPSLASIGEFVNGKNGAYRPIRDAKKEFFAHFSLEAKFVALPQDLSAEGDGQ